MPCLSIPNHQNGMHSQNLERSHSGDPGSSSSTTALEKVPSVSWNPQLHFDKAHLLSMAGLITASMKYTFLRSRISQSCLHSMSSVSMCSYEMHRCDSSAGSVFGNMMHLNLASNVPPTMTSPLDEHSTGKASQRTFHLTSIS